MNESIEESI